MDLKEKVAVVTGATGGMGREVVKLLDNEGVNLILVSRTENELQNLIKSLKGKNNKYYVCDLSNLEETQRVAKEIAGDFKNIDILINLAGIGIYKPLNEMNLEDWTKTMNINVSSVFIFTKELIDLLGNVDGSLILNMGSGAGVIPMAVRSAYCSSKFALRGLTLSLSEEYERIGKPKFCLITMGSTLTSFGPMSKEEKIKEMESGKAYFTPEWVGKKLVEIIKDDNRDTEYTIYPQDYTPESFDVPESK